MVSRGELASGVAITAVILSMGATAQAQTAPTTTDQAQTVLTGKPVDKPADRKRRATKTRLGDPGPAVTNDSGRLEGDIIVTGLRENVKTSRSIKRRAQQIVDVVLAQDIGKLPDKNVPEALARVPGVQIDRERGEGGKVLIRGLDGVMTTVNGSATFSAGDRTTYLNDISSDLVAGIEVYKTRTPDQVEGSQSGVINLTLRRPTDFKEGATYAFSVRGDYADQIKRFNPYASALVAYNADTGIGRLGFSVNGTYNRVDYSEAVRFNGIPQRPGDSRQIILPSTTPANIFLPRDVGFAGTDGWSERAAFQASAQWRPDDNWIVTLEGGYANQKMLWADSLFIIPLLYSGSSAPPPRLSNLVMADDGRLAKSVTVDSIDPIGPGRQSWLHETTNYNGRLQAEYKSDRFEFNGWVNYQRSNNDSNNLFHYLRFNQQPQFDVTFNTPDEPKGGPIILFKNIDLLDRSNYRYLDGVNQSKQLTYSGEVEMKGDLKLNTFGNFIDYLKIGYRYARRTYRREYGYREIGNLRVPLSALPDYELTQVGPLFQATGATGAAASASANWLIGDTVSIRDSWNALRARIATINPDYANHYPAYDPLQRFTGADGSHAFYGMAHYNLDLLFPIEGTVGARIVNGLTALNATERVQRFQNVGGRLTLTTTDTIISPRGNFLDVLPSLNAIVHFTPKLQLRASYTYDVGRPSVYQINPQLFLNLQNTAQPSASGGNPDLGPVRLSKYDASLEWYFGTTGSASVAVWQWNQEGLVANRTLAEALPGSPNAPVLVTRPYNLGRGRHRGIEGSLTSFFTFMPGILKSFGGTVNGTLNITRQAYPIFAADGTATYAYGPYLNVSKYAYNLIGFFERGGLNVRVAYNWRSKRQIERNGLNPYQNQFLDPVERLDASINYDITKNLTVAVDASNITRNGNLIYWGSYDAPRDIRYFSRNYSVSIRTRF